MSDITAAEARELLDYDPETGILTRKIRTSSRVQVGAQADMELVGYANFDQLDNMLEDRTAILHPKKTGFAGTAVYRARAALATHPAAEQLWAVHAQGPDDLYAAFSREEAEAHAAELNALPCWAGISVSAVVIESPWPAAEHWKYLVEQDREHNNFAVRGVEHDE